MLQGKHSTQPAVREQLGRAQERILAMGAVYRHLYSVETTGHVELGDFIKMICAESERAYVGANRPIITCEVEQIEVSGSQATSLAVLAHELITNALKHAYLEGQPGPITLRLRRTADGTAELSVSDCGQGIPPEMSIEKPLSLGFKVIMATVRQFGGALTINRLDPGTEIIIRFPPSFGAAAVAAAPNAA
jgi:two-component sensor histidine kinase